MKILLSIRIRELNSTIYYINKYVIIIIYVKGELLDKLLVVIKITIEVYLINNLKINILIKNNVLIL